MTAQFSLAFTVSRRKTFWENPFLQTSTLACWVLFEKPFLWDFTIWWKLMAVPSQKVRLFISCQSRANNCTYWRRHLEPIKGKYEVPPHISASNINQINKNCKNCECCPYNSLFKGHVLWILNLLFSIVKNVISVSKVTNLYFVLWGCSSMVIVFVFFIFILFVCVIVFFVGLLISLIKCLKGHKSLGSLFEGVL